LTFLQDNVISNVFDMNDIIIPFNADQHVYYAVFSKTHDGNFAQCSKECEDLATSVDEWRDLTKQEPDKTFGIYHVMVSQIYVPLDP